MTIEQKRATTVCSNEDDRLPILYKNQSEAQNHAISACSMNEFWYNLTTVLH